MALFMKQDFTPPLLSRKWFAIKLRPNMLLYTREHVISILESGLMFREDSIEVEQETPDAEAVWAVAGGGSRGWLTKGERVVSAVAILACLVAFPPRSVSRGSVSRCVSYAFLPLVVRGLHRRRCEGGLKPLLDIMRQYLALARRSAACLKEYKALHTHTGSMSSVIESMHTLLCRQQSEMAIVMSRASSAVLGNAPWLRSDVAWDAVTKDTEPDNLMKIHHAFLVVQSTLLKHIAMAHFIQSPHARKIYKNHNERVHWIHATLIGHLHEEFRQNLDALERVYRLLKNSGTKDEGPKRLGSAINDSWLYSEVHTGVVKTCLELKLAMNKSNSLDMFLDSCATNRQDVNVDILSKDFDELIDSISKCLTTVQHSQVRLRKLKSRFGVKENRSDVTVDDVVDASDDVIVLNNSAPEPKDEVFYLLRTDDDDVERETVADVTTMPGQRERDNTRVVLCELKRKLGKREDTMRERERQALAKTMPELRIIPEFPRQIAVDDYAERKGLITKLNVRRKTVKLFNNYRIGHFKRIKRLGSIKTEFKYSKYVDRNDIVGEIYEASTKICNKNHLITISPLNKQLTITKWYKIDSSGDHSRCTDDSSYANASSSHKNDIDIIKFTKKDLELTPSSSDSEFDYCERNEILKDVRKHRVARRVNCRTATDNMDESLRPIEYNFGTGLAMASVLQVNSKAFMSNMSREEVFMGDGEVSDDSGNDDV